MDEALADKLVVINISDVLNIGLYDIRCGETSSDQATSKASEVVVKDTSENLKHEEDSRPMPYGNHSDAHPKNDDDSNNQSNEGETQITFPLDENRESKQDTDNVNNKSNEGPETNVDSVKLDIAGTEKVGSPKEVLNSNIHPDSQEDTHVSCLKDENCAEFNDQMNNRNNEDQESNMDYLGSDNTGKEQASSSTEVLNSGCQPIDEDDTHASNPMNENLEDSHIKGKGGETSSDQATSKTSEIVVKDTSENLKHEKDSMPYGNHSDAHPKNDDDSNNQPNEGDTQITFPLDENRDFKQDTDNMNNKSNEGPETNLDSLKLDIAGTENVGSSNIHPDSQEDTHVSYLKDANCAGFNDQMNNRNNEDQESNMDSLGSDNTGKEQASILTEVSISGCQPIGEDDASNPMDENIEDSRTKGKGEETSSQQTTSKTSKIVVENMSENLKHEEDSMPNDNHFESNPQNDDNDSNNQSDKGDTHISSTLDENRDTDNENNKCNGGQENNADCLKLDITCTGKTGSAEEVLNSNTDPDSIEDTHNSNLEDENRKDSDQIKNRIDEDQEIRSDYNGKEAGSSTEVQNRDYHSNGEDDAHASNPGNENCEDSHIKGKEDHNPKFNEESDQIHNRSDEDQESNTDILGSENTCKELAGSSTEVQNSDCHSKSKDDTHASNSVNENREDLLIKCEGGETSSQQTTKTSEIVVEGMSDNLKHEKDSMPNDSHFESNPKNDDDDESNNQSDKGDTQISSTLDGNREFKQDTDNVNNKSNEGRETNTDCLKLDITSTGKAGNQNRIDEDQEISLRSDNNGKEQAGSSTEVQNSDDHPNNEDDTYASNPGNENRDFQTDKRVSERHQGTGIQQPVRVKEKYSELIPSAGFRSQIYNRDCERFRNGYPDDEVDDENLQNNWFFYNNEIKFEPRGEYIDIMHSEWKWDYKRLETNHCYIQWLFPIREQGVNHFSQILQPHEAKKITLSAQARKRVINSLELMLDFYGISVKENTKDSYKLCRSSDWELRFHHLNWSYHNWQRITRILKCMCELGFVDVQPPLIWFFFNEIFITGKLYRAEKSFMEFWLQTLKDDKMRLHIEEEAGKIKRGTPFQFSDSLILPKSFTDAKDLTQPDKETDSVSLQEMDQELSKESEGAVNNNGDKKLMITLQVESSSATSANIECEIDTGASCCIMSQDELDKIERNIELKHSSTKLKMYNDQEVKVHAKALEMGLIIGAKDIHQATVQDSITSILDTYSDVFEGLGCLPGAYEIEIDESIQPVKNRPRRVAVAIKDELKFQLLDLEQRGIIEKVTKPTDWLSSMVVG
ncbi:GATA zinc finger domain-containing protein 14-like [Anneissia japonica]|uniref:GATA zinc finger domain-containing protein 14-like n=1 Tax=Anneissia japonica TaxID=1529436 RepID=UPI001425BB0D|nr:GATA zinc finger domain-containing protein 14-like [Anneissia japonica]